MRDFQCPKDFENTSTDNDSICLTNDESDEDGNAGADVVDASSEPAVATATLQRRETIDSQSSLVIDEDESGPPLEVDEATDIASEIVTEEEATVATPPVDELEANLSDVDNQEVVVRVVLECLSLVVE